MYKTRIFVDDSSIDNINSEQKELDLFDGETVPICFTYNTLDFKLDIPFSYTYKIPMTPKNVSLLGLDIRNNILYSTRKQTYFVTVTIDDVHVFSGSLYVSEVSKNNVSVNLKCFTSSSINSLSSIKMYNEYNYLDRNVSIEYDKSEHHYLDWWYNLKYSNSHTGRTTTLEQYSSIDNGCYLESFSPQVIYEIDGQKRHEYFPIGDSKNQPCAFHNEMFLNGISQTYQIPIYINNLSSTSYNYSNSTHCMFIPTSSHYMDSISGDKIYAVNTDGRNKSYSILIAPLLYNKNGNNTMFTESETYTTHVTINHKDTSITCRYPNSVNVGNNVYISSDSTFRIKQELFDNFQFRQTDSFNVYYCEYNKSMGDSVLIDAKEYLIAKITEPTIFRIGDYFPDGITYKKDGTIIFFKIRLPFSYLSSFGSLKSEDSIKPQNVYDIDYKIRFCGDAISDSSTLPNVSQIYSCWMPDISINDYIVNYANIVNQGTAYYSPVNDSIIIKNYNNIKGWIDISEYVSEITKISKIYDEHYIDIVNEIYDNKRILYRFETNNTSKANKTLFKSIIVDIPKDGYDGEDYNFNTIGTSDKNLFLISTYGQEVSGNGTIMITNNQKISDIIDNNGALKQMIYANEKVEVTIKCSSKMLFDILSFDSKILLRQLNTTFILNKATLTKDGAKLILIAI